MSYRNANINPYRGWNKLLTDNMCNILRSKLPPGNWPLLDQWSGDPRITRTTQTQVVSNTLRQTFSLMSNRWNTIDYKPTQYQRILSNVMRPRYANDVKLPSSTGGSSTWVDTFCDSTSPVTSDALVTALTQCFKPEGQEEAHKVPFWNRFRGKDETFMEYGYALRRLATRAFPQIKHEAHE